MTSRNPIKTKSEIIRSAGKEIVMIYDNAGNLLHKIINPLGLKFYLHDAVQMIVGAAILAIPVALTEETWKFGETLPPANIAGFSALSILFIAAFLYYNNYRGCEREFRREFWKRLFATYAFSLLVSALLLTLFERAPWATDFLLAIKRAVIVAFPASMSAAAADMIK